MQPLVIDATRLPLLLAQLWWPALRIGGFVASAPIVSAITVPPRVKVVLTLAIAFLLAPTVVVPSALTIFSARGVLVAIQDFVIGLSIGTVAQIAFEAISFAGQTIATTMGIGFASLIDPQRGANSPAVGQLFMAFAVLTYLAIDGHLMLFAELARSFRTLPVGANPFGRGDLLAVATWGGRIFQSGILIALPAVVALIIVNLALGVLTRAAPQMNLFGVGFPLTMAAGYLVLLIGVGGLGYAIVRTLHQSLAAVAQMTAGAVPRVP